MSLSRLKVNELSVLGYRKLSFIPAHFKKTSLVLRYNTTPIQDWIEFNLNGRYAIQNTFKLDSNKKMILKTEIGFEIHSELVMFLLGCQELN